MAKTLVILESPGKVKAISKYLGTDYEVIASNGHVIDLPVEELGVDVDNEFAPSYQVIKGTSQAAKIIKKIEELAKVSNKVLIATDPDREGEAIGWHIANRIKDLNKSVFRITFNEITKKGVMSGIANEGSINKDLVDAQQARRIMDRLVGYKVSPFLWKIISNKLSAGRVQSVALRIICERDDAIAKFQPEEYWNVLGGFQSVKGSSFDADLQKINGKEANICSEEEFQELLPKFTSEKYFIQNITKKEVAEAPPPPFITSTLLQESFKKLGFSTQKTMKIAQDLYEGIEIGEDGVQGLITYMRTDSTRISEDAIDELRDFISKKYGINSVSKKRRVYKSGKNIQDAHEAVRPTNINYEPKKIAQYLDTDTHKDHFRLYKLIWVRFASTQFNDALFDQTVVDISSQSFNFKISDKVPKSKGFKQLHGDNAYESDDEEVQKKSKLPGNLDVGESLLLQRLDAKQKYTSAAGHYNEASLTKELESLEIGRPSTYATIVEKLVSQKYITKKYLEEVREVEERSVQVVLVYDGIKVTDVKTEVIHDKKPKVKKIRGLLATELGALVNRMLVENFPDIFNVEFTKKMESELDSVEFGNTGWVKVLTDFFGPFKTSLDIVMEKKNEIKKETVQKVGRNCPECKTGDLLFKWGKNGKFIACSNFPACKYTSSADDSPDKPEVVKEIVGKCDKCSGNLVVKHGRYGRFVACDNYPACKNIIKEELNIPCPKEGCTGLLKERKSKRGKRFYGCANYPECDFVLWNKPVEKPCPSCGFKILEEVPDNKTKTVKLVCPGCKSEFDAT